MVNTNTSIPQERVSNFTTDHQDSRSLDLKVKDPEISKDHDLRCALPKSAQPVSQTPNPTPAFRGDGAMKHTPLTPAEVAANKAWLLEHVPSGLTALASWRQEPIDHVAAVFAQYPLTMFDWRYAPAAAARLHQKAPLHMRTNPDGTMVTFLRRQPEWWPVDFVETPDGSGIALPLGAVAQIRSAAPDKFSTVEALARAIQRDCGNAQETATHEILAAIAILRPELSSGISHVTLGVDERSVQVPVPRDDAQAPAMPPDSTWLLTADYSNDFALWGARVVLRALEKRDRVQFHHVLSVVLDRVLTSAQGSRPAAHRRLEQAHWPAEWLPSTADADVTA